MEIAGTTTAEIQAEINYAKALGLPITFQPRLYEFDQSLDFTGGPEGWRIEAYGATLQAKLAEAYAALDFTGTTQMIWRGGRIVGGQVGIQTAAMLFGREAATLAGDKPRLADMKIVGSFALAAVVNVSADLMSIRDCELYGPTPLVIAPTDILGIGSKYKAFATTTGNTLHTVDAGTLVASGRAGVLYDSGAALVLRGVYCSLQGLAMAMIELSGSGGKSVFLYGCRMETATTSGGRILTGAPSQGGEISGNYQNVDGPLIDVDLTGYRIGLLAQSSSVPLIDGHKLRGCLVINGQGLPATLDALSTGNLVVQSGGTQWPFPATHDLLVKDNKIIAIGGIQ